MFRALGVFMRCISIVLTLAACILSPVALAQSGPAVQSDLSVRQSLAREFVDLFNSPQIVSAQRRQLAGQVADKMLASFKDSAQPDVNLAAFRSDIEHVMFDALTGFANRTEKQSREEIAALYYDNMTAADLKEILAFYKSPMGQRLTNRVQSSLNMSKSIDEALQNGADGKKTAKPDVKLSTIQGDREKSVQSAVSQMTYADRIALGMMSVRPSMQRFIALNSRRAVLEAKWINATDPIVEKEIEDGIAAAVRRHLGGPETQVPGKKAPVVSVPSA
jgi:hypothetical protein